MTDAGTIGHVAFAAWMQDNLSERFNTVLDEPVPQVLLAIFDAGTEANAASRPVRSQPGRAQY
jgi:hypothetical protein